MNQAWSHYTQINVFKFWLSNQGKGLMENVLKRKRSHEPVSVPLISTPSDKARNRTTELIRLPRWKQLQNREIKRTRSAECDSVTLASVAPAVFAQQKEVMQDEAVNESAALQTLKCMEGIWFLCCSWICSLMLTNFVKNLISINFLASVMLLFYMIIRLTWST